MEKKNIIKVYTTSSGAELNISAPNTKQVISATNNRAQYFAELAKKYRDEAQEHRDNAKFYAEQNSDVTFEYIENIKNSLENKIARKQDIGDYALRDEIPTKLSELDNNTNYINTEEVSMKIDEVRLPKQENNAGKFLMTDGEIEKWVGISSFKLFDIKLSDHVLTGEEAKGWALQGSYVNGAIYPDFYAKCIEEYNQATATETINGVTVKVHSNGHKFYNISDKTAIDEFFNTIGSAWFYGVDTENERIFLPRNNYFEQVTSSAVDVGQSVEAGLPNITGEFGAVRWGSSIGNGAFTNTGSGTASISGGGGLENTYGLYSLDASRSNAIYGNSDTVQPNAVKKLLYICVGNTIVNEDQIDVSKVLSEAVLRSSLEEVQTVIETYKNGTSWYRVWSDGWCEQGGYYVPTATTGTITLLKSYKNTDYSITTGGSRTGNDNMYTPTVGVTKTASDFSIYCGSTVYRIYWQASGYIW